MADDRELFIHKEWLGLIQPVGLVVTARSLLRAQAIPDRTKATDLQPILQGLMADGYLQDFRAFTEQILEWDKSDLVDAPDGVEVYLENYGETLKPTYAVPNPDGEGWLMLVQQVEADISLDEKFSSQGWEVTPQQKFERLLRGTKIPMGLLTNGRELRLVYAPEGESSGHLTFSFVAMTEVAGRSLLSAMYMLLSAYRVFQANVLKDDRSLGAILEKSRLYQNEVSERLADQVLDALWQLLGGFQAAATNGKMMFSLDNTEGMQHIYGGLVTVLMRLVFLLYAEERDVMPGDPIYQGSYAVTGLYEKLRDDASNYPDTMDQRFGAWAWLLSLFRLVYDGGGATAEYLPARHGQLFDPDAYCFLEGRVQNSLYEDSGYVEIPRVPDETIFRVLEKLLILDGERLSYRALDVENIGSVYEGIMGYRVEQAQSVCLGVTSKPKGSKVSTTVVIDMQALLQAKGTERSQLLKTWANCEISPNAQKEIKEAKTLEAIAAALGRKVSHRTPHLLTKGTFYLQPTEERRRSGSHYTPRKLTEPIVRKTMEPILAELGATPTAEQILSLKVCDLAMGSGAFLVEACRQLADAVVAAWERDGMPDDLPKTEEPILIARRLVAQRCIYGVDKNPFAVNLAKLSLWLATLAKDLPFTFIDHALKCGDSLVGLTKAEIGSFGKEINDLPLMRLLNQKVEQAKSYRAAIQAGDTRTDEDAETKAEQLLQAEAVLQESKLIGSVIVASFFDGSNAKERKEKRVEYAEEVRGFRQSGEIDKLEALVRDWQKHDHAIIPFNWELEFPEVFDRENSGFDAIVGNPPFAGKNTTINGNAEGYLDWLKVGYPESHGNSDLVAYFFRRAFSLLRKDGTFGLVSTNTIAQGDTRSTGLRFICLNGGTIYNATRRHKWEGAAAVVVSLIHIIKATY